MVLLRLTAEIEGRSCWPSFSPGVSLGGYWSSPSPLSYPKQYAAVREQRTDVRFQPAVGSQQR